jgi:hypothetical protein
LAVDTQPSDSSIRTLVNPQMYSDQEIAQSTKHQTHAEKNPDNFAPVIEFNDTIQVKGKEERPRFSAMAPLSVRTRNEALRPRESINTDFDHIYYTTQSVFTPKLTLGLAKVKRPTLASAR